MLELFESLVVLNSHPFLHNFSVLFDFVSDSVKHLLRRIIRRHTFLSVIQRLLKTHQLVFSVLKLIPVRLNLLRNSNLFLLLLPQLTGGNEHGIHLRLASMLRFHGVDFSGQLFLFLLKFGQFLLQIGRILSQPKSTKELD